MVNKIVDKVQLKKSTGGKWFMRALSNNGRIITSSQQYASKAAAKRTAKQLAKQLDVNLELA